MHTYKYINYNSVLGLRPLNHIIVSEWYYEYINSFILCPIRFLSQTVITFTLANYQNCFVSIDFLNNIWEDFLVFLLNVNRQTGTNGLDIPEETPIYSNNLP